MGKVYQFPKGDTRWLGGGPARLLAAADGYVMARRPGCMPFVIPVNQWLALEPATPPAAAREEGK